MPPGVVLIGIYKPSPRRLSWLNAAIRLAQQIARGARFRLRSRRLKAGPSHAILKIRKATLAEQNCGVQNYGVDLFQCRKGRKIESTQRICLEF
jgi:hypothetical protein